MEPPVGNASGKGGSRTLKAHRSAVFGTAAIAGWLAFPTSEPRRTAIDRSQSGGWDSNPRSPVSEAGGLAAFLPPVGGDDGALVRIAATGRRSTQRDLNPHVRDGNAAGCRYIMGARATKKARCRDDTWPSWTYPRGSVVTTGTCARQANCRNPPKAVGQPIGVDDVDEARSWFNLSQETKPIFATPRGSVSAAEASGTNHVECLDGRKVREISKKPARFRCQWALADSCGVPLVGYNGGRPHRDAIRRTALAVTRSMSVPDADTAREQALLDVLRRLGSVAVALSGGIDSTVVACAAKRALGDRAVAVTADSPSVPRAELETARRLARLIGIRHEILATEEFANADYVRNDGSRCYHCKSELYGRLERELPRLGVRYICSGANVDDLGDYRPGLQAAEEYAVRHPLQEAGFTKEAVRRLAKKWDLPTWDKPASPCLSSRLAPGVAVTPERTARVEAAERFLHDHGFAECRVRLHEGELARIEVPVAVLDRFVDEDFRVALSQELRRLGFRFVTLDLDGFRSGSLNDLVPLEQKRLYAREKDDATVTRR